MCPRYVTVVRKNLHFDNFNDTWELSKMRKIFASWKRRLSADFENQIVPLIYTKHVFHLNPDKMTFNAVQNVNEALINPNDIRL